MVVLSDLARLGVDTRRVFVVDVTGEATATSTHDPDHHMALPSPTLLELIAKRAEKVIRYVSNHLAPKGLTIDYLLEPGPIPDGLRQFLDSFMDEQTRLPPGA